MSKITITNETPELVPLLGDFHVPRTFTAVIVDGATVTLDVEVDGERPRCRRLEVEAIGDTDISGDTLRRIPVMAYLLEAVRLAVYKRHDVSDLPDWIAQGLAEDGVTETFMDPSEDERRVVYRDVASNARRPRRGSPVNDEHLQQVADLYRMALERGDPPAKTIAEQMHAARSTAARWVGLARKRGLLGPALPGRAGEAA